jgi:hypothetical protein
MIWSRPASVKAGISFQSLLVSCLAQILRSAAASVMPTGIVERDFLEPVSGNLLNDIINGPRLGSENLDPGIMEHLHGPETHASGDDRFDLSSLERRDRVALAMGMGLVPIVDDFDTLRFDIDKGEVGGAAEVPVDPGLKAFICFGRNANFHGRTPPPRKPPWPALHPQPRSAGTRWMSAFPQ